MKSNRFKTLAIIPVLALCVGAVFIHPDVRAWNCGEGPDNQQNIEPGFSAVDDNCFNKNLQEANQNFNPPMTAKDFEALVHSCNEKGGDNDRECADAVASCAQKALDVSKCRDAETIYQIADNANCSDGRLSDGSSCKPLANMNYDTLKEQAAKADAAAAACDETNAKVYGQCQQAAIDAKKACWDKIGIGAEGPNGSYAQGNKAVEAKNANFDQCIKDEMLKRAPQDSQEFCKAAGGIYTGKDTPDPNGNNKEVKKGCHRGYSDLDNPDACAASGTDKQNRGVWAQDKSNGRWGCYNPKEVCGDDKAKDYQINDQKPCDEYRTHPIIDPDDTSPNKTVTNHDKEDFETCGEASVNLLSCSDAADGACPGSGQGQPFEGVQVLGCVLKIGLQALTVLVGIGAVGGIAYSSFRYASASDNAGAVTEAKGRIRDIVIGLIVYVFLLAVVQWLVPGLVMDTGTSSSGTPATQASP